VVSLWRASSKERLAIVVCITIIVVPVLLRLRFPAFGRVAIDRAVPAFIATYFLFCFYATAAAAPIAAFRWLSTLLILKMPHGFRSLSYWPGTDAWGFGLDCYQSPSQTYV
jgi:hypothetical protein